MSFVANSAVIGAAVADGTALVTQRPAHPRRALETDMTLKPNTSLDALVATLRDGVRFFRDAEHDSATRASIATAYRQAAELRGVMLADLQKLGFIDGTRDGETIGSPDTGELSYAELAARRRSQGDASIADELRRRELGLLQLMGHVLREHGNLALRRMLKASVPPVSRLVEAWRRLGLRAHAA
jgi:hypothetical protein